MDVGQGIFDLRMSCPKYVGDYGSIFIRRECMESSGTLDC